MFFCSTCQSPGIQTIHFGLVCMRFCQHQHVCAHGLNIAFSTNEDRVRKYDFDIVTHFLWVVVLVNTILFMRERESSGKKVTSETFPFIDIVNRSNFDPVRLIISRMERYTQIHVLCYDAWMSVGKWFIFPKANGFQWIFRFFFLSLWTCCMV